MEKKHLTWLCLILFVIFGGVWFACQYWPSKVHKELTPASAKDKIAQNAPDTPSTKKQVPQKQESHAIRIVGHVVSEFEDIVNEAPPDLSEAGRGFSFELATIADAKVILEDPRHRSQTRTTDEEGHFEFSVKPVKGDYTLTFDAEGFALYREVLQIDSKDIGQTIKLDEIELYKAVNITIQVRSFRGDPIDNATFYGKPFDFVFSEDKKDFIKATHLGKGIYFLERISNRMDSIYVQAPNYVPDWTYVEDSTDGPLQVELFEASAINGRVESLQGNPIADAVVWINKNEAYGPQLDLDHDIESRTDARGRFQLPSLTPEEYIVRVRADGYVSEKKQAATGFDDLVFRLTREARLGGQVLSAKNNKPIEGALVAIQTQSTLSHLEVYQDLIAKDVTPFAQMKTRTDNAGRFLFKGLWPDTYNIDIGHARYTTTRTGPWELKARDAIENQRFILASGLTITGKVTANTDGQPVPNVKVTLFQPGDTNLPQFKRTFKSSPDGSFTATGFRSGTCEVSAEVAGFVKYKAEINIPSLKDVDLHISLARPGIITGRILDMSGHPIGQAEIRLYPGDLRSGSKSNGDFSFDKIIPEKPYQIAAFSESRMLWGYSQEISVAAGEHRADLQIHLTRGKIIRGRVMEADGRGTQASIHAVATENPKDPMSSWVSFVQEYMYQPVVENDGFFELQIFQPGRYKVEAYRDGRTTSHAITVQKIDDSILEGIELTLPDGGTIGGQVVNTQRQPLADVTVGYEGPGAFNDNTCTTDAQGLFRLTGAPLGVCTLECFHDNYAHKDIANIKVPCENLTIVLEKLAKVTGQLHYGRLNSFPQGDVYGQRVYSAHASSNMAGRFIVDVAPGKPLICIKVPGFAPTAIVCPILPGESKHIDIPLRRKCLVKGLVIRMGTGEPVPEAEVFIETDGHQYRSDLSTPVWTTTDTDGSFWLDDAAEGSSIITARHPLGLGKSNPVQLKPNQMAELVIELEQGTGIIGTMSDEWGAIRGEKIKLFNDAGALQAETTTDDRGQFHFTGVPAGEYNIVYEAFTYKAPSQKVGTTSKKKVAVERGKYTRVDFGV